MVISQGFSKAEVEVDEVASSKAPKDFARNSSAADQRKKIDEQRQSAAISAFKKAGDKLLSAGETISSAGENLSEKEPVKEAQEAAITTMSGAFAPLVAAADRLTGFSQMPKKLFGAITERFQKWREPGVSANLSRGDDPSEGTEAVVRKLDEEIVVHQKHFDKVEAHQKSLSEDFEDAFDEALQRNLKEPALVWDSSLGVFQNVWKWLLEESKQKFFTDATKQADLERFQEELLERNDEIIDVLQRASDENGSSGKGGLLALLGAGAVAAGVYLKRKITNGIFKPLTDMIMRRLLMGIAALKGMSLAPKLMAVTKAVLKSTFTKVFAAMFSVRAIFAAIDEVTNMSDEAIDKAGGFFPAIIQKFGENLIGAETLAKLQEGFGRIAEPLFDLVKKAIDGIVEWWGEPSNFLEGATTIIKGFIAIHAWFLGLIKEYIIDPLMKGIDTFLQPFRNVVSKAIENIVGWVTELKDTAIDKVSRAMESAFNWVDEKLKPLRDLRDTVSSLFDRILDNPLFRLLRDSQGKQSIERLGSEGVINDRNFALNAAGIFDEVDFKKLADAVTAGSVSKTDLEAVKERLKLPETDVRKLDDLIGAIDQVNAASTRLRQSNETLPALNQRSQSEAFTQAVMSGTRQNNENQSRGQAQQINHSTFVNMQGAQRVSPNDPALFLSLSL